MGGLDLVSSLLKIVVVFALLALTLRGLARYQRGRPGRRSGTRGTPPALIEVLDQSRLGRSANLVAVRVGPRVLLLGLTDSRIEMLADIGDDLVVEPPDPPDPDQDRTTVLDHALEILGSRVGRTTQVRTD